MLKLLFLSLISFSSIIWAESDLTFVAVGQAEKSLDQIVFAKPTYEGLGKGDQEKVEEIVKIWKNDFSFYKQIFSVIDHPIEGAYDGVKSEELNKKGFSYVVALKAQNQDKKILVKLKSYALATNQIVYQNTFFIEGDDILDVAHKEANAIYRSVTGKDSIFGTKIYFVSDRSSVKNETRKELYVMDFDGKRPKRLTYHESIVISPAVSHDGNKVLYSVMNKNSKTRIKNIDLNVFEISSGKISPVSNKKGINSGAIFSQDDKFIYLTLSFGGNADIYKMNWSSGDVEKITTHWGEDVDPSINVDGSQMVFLSNRSGKAHIYTMDPRSPEKNIKRISFVGQFNAAPRFSPDGKEIVFSSWVDNLFDLYKIDFKGQNLIRLTKDFGSNEEASFSPDGEFVLFTSQRVLGKTEATQDVYIMTREGDIVGKITQDFGKCTSPRWSK